MLTLDNKDIEAHKTVAKQLDRVTLSSIINSINSEYHEIKETVSSKERANYQKLLDIYSNELMSRYTSNVQASSHTLH